MPAKQKLSGDDRARVWYASYGSNMQRDRFGCYLTGGRPRGSAVTQPGCSDPAEPLADAPLRIPRQLYFARRSRSWSYGGVAFLGEAPGMTLGRRYLITIGQLTDIIRQECGITDPLMVDYDAAVRNGKEDVRRGAWYGRLLHLGDSEGYPTFTFTSADHHPADVNPPSLPYLLTIVDGLRETHGYGAAESAAYLAKVPGIRGVWSEEELRARLAGEPH
ncbi:histone deacetylase [Lewinella sp. IMCC34183]|uniref:histone deacetylase n=1 Tax=Lewinella sp. IMCC34183 TaxID=2248762 RepID=UPI000E221885|nr:histone deacetylase [Lewinella sp. IMCC34183]